MVINKSFSARSDMFFRSRHLIQLILLAILMLGTIVACQDSAGQNIASQSSAMETENCRIVEHHAGKTEVCGQPQTVTALSPRVLDPMLALDIQPAAYAENASFDFRRFDNPNEQIPHLGKLITTQPINLGDRNTPSLETLVEVNPDLIVGETWQENELFSKIAPTLLFNNQIGKDGWSYRLKIIAQAFGREEQAKQVVAQYEEKLAQVQAELAPIIDAYPRILPIGTNGSIFYINSYGSDIAALLEEIGFQLVLFDGLPRETPNSPDAPQISIEALVQLDPDIIIITAWNANDFYNPERAIKRQWEETPLLQNMRAVKEGRIHFVDGQLWDGTRGGSIAYGIMLDQLPDLLLPFVEEDRS